MERLLYHIIKNYNDWYHNHTKLKYLYDGAIQYDAEGCSYKTTSLENGATGLCLFDEKNMVSYNQGKFCGIDTRLIFDYSHLSLWRRIHKNKGRDKEFDKIENDYKEKILPLLS